MFIIFVGYFISMAEQVNMQNIRNIAIIAHVDHGKTTLVDRILYPHVTFHKRVGNGFRPEGNVVGFPGLDGGVDLQSRTVLDGLCGVIAGENIIQALDDFESHDAVCPRPCFAGLPGRL